MKNTKNTKNTKAKAKKNLVIAGTSLVCAALVCVTVSRFAAEQNAPPDRTYAETEPAEIVTTVVTTSPHEISETLSLKNTMENTEDLPIVMVVLYENYAWGEDQDITIIDSRGSYYYLKDEQIEQLQDNSIWFDFDKDDWYNTLCSIAKLGEVTELSDGELKVILNFSENYEEVSKSRYYKEYESTLRDYGNYFLYGIYNDDGKPKYVLLSQYGNGIKCLDDEHVVNFVNQMIGFGIFPAGHKNFQY